jgi:2-polyprenyl-3-methyl-5-hydroxy-6-metoxy-1,4-benzoquinol methylase
MAPWPVSEDRSDHVAMNRRHWDEDAAAWHGPLARGHWSRPEPCWGLWSTPESEPKAVPHHNVAATDVTELGCRIGYVSAWLARAGARPVGVDVSREQLATAHALPDGADETADVGGTALLGVLAPVDAVGGAAVVGDSWLPATLP